MPVFNIYNGSILDISTNGDNTLITVTYQDDSASNYTEQTVVLVASPRTIILNSNGNPILASSLEIGMLINATASTVTTRSNPPQSNAYLIIVLPPESEMPEPIPRPMPSERPDEPNRPPRPMPPNRPPRPDERITIGTIINLERNNRNFTTISNRDFATLIRFNVPENTPIFDRTGRPIDFSRLIPGMRVQVRHANFMTSSIPPQTTAFEVQIL